MPTDTPTTPAAAWVGWVRHAGSPWRPVAEGDDHAGVWEGLLAHVTSGTHVERLVLPAGQHPATRRARR
jgi:hypothetical protein